MAFGLFSLTDGFLGEGLTQRTIQRQFNVVDNVSVQAGSHALKFGIDFRRLSPISRPFLYSQFPGFNDVPSAESGSLAFSSLEAQTNTVFLFPSARKSSQGHEFRSRPWHREQSGCRADPEQNARQREI